MKSYLEQKNDNANKAYHQTIHQNTTTSNVVNHSRTQQIAQLQSKANKSSRVESLTQLQEKANNSLRTQPLTQLRELSEEATLNQEKPVQNKKNNTGLPDKIKSGIENLSGYSMDDVKVHYNSDKPAQLQAHAYAQGTDIHIASGQEKHLPHEAWHVVQQKQGRVKPTLQMNGGIDVNDNEGLEKEAEIMGNKICTANSNYLIGKSSLIESNKNILSNRQPTQCVLKKDRLNVIGEHHDSYKNKGRKDEKNILKEELNTSNYWQEYEFKVVTNKPLFILVKNKEFADRYDIVAHHLIYQLLNKLNRYDNLLSEKGFSVNLHKKQKKAFILFWNRIIHRLNLFLKQKDASNDPEAINIRKHHKEFSEEKKIEIKSSFESLSIPVDGRVGKLREQIMNIKGLISKYAISIFSITKSETELMHERDLKMHQAAQKMWNTKGVWKIGNAHAKNIQKEYQGSKNAKLLKKFGLETNRKEEKLKYNLVTKEEFDNFLRNKKV